MKTAKFKDSPLGPIPHDWEVKRLGKICDVQLGKMLDSAKNQGEECFYLTNKDVQWGRISVSDLRRMRMSEDDRQRFSLRQGDLLVCEGGEVGRCAIWNSEVEGCCFQKTIHRVRANVSDTIDMRFLQPLLCVYAKKGVFDPYISCTSIAHLTKEKFELLEIICPPVPEQQRIAEALGEVDKLIESLDEQVEKKRLIAKGVAHDLLSGKKRLPGFEGEWEKKDYKDVFLHHKGKSIGTSEYESSGQFPVIDQGQEAVVAYSDNTDALFHVPDGGAIVFGDHTRIVKYVSKDFIVGADGTQILSGLGCDTQFLYHALRQVEIPNLGYNRHFKFIKDHQYSLPHTLAEQQAIADLLSEQDAAIAALEAKREKYVRIKDGMMRDLLTGQVRMKGE